MRRTRPSTSRAGRSGRWPRPRSAEHRQQLVDDHRAGVLAVRARVPVRPAAVGAPRSRTAARRGDRGGEEPVEAERGLDERRRGRRRARAARPRPAARWSSPGGRIRHQPVSAPRRAAETKLPYSTGPGSTSGTTPAAPLRPRRSWSHGRPGSTPCSTPTPAATTTVAPAAVPPRRRARRLSTPASVPALWMSASGTRRTGMRRTCSRRLPLTRPRSTCCTPGTSAGRPPGRPATSPGCGRSTRRGSAAGRADAAMLRAWRRTRPAGRGAGRRSC